MRFFTRASSLLLALSLLIVPQVVLPQEQPTAEPATDDEGWSRIAQLKDSQKVEVLMLDGSHLTGTVKDWRTASFSLQRSRNRTDLIRKSNIQRVSALERGSAKKSALIGALAGFGIGFVIGAAKAGDIADVNNPSYDQRLGAGVGIGAVFAGVGALVGLAMPGQKRTVLYRVLPP